MKIWEIFEEPLLSEKSSELAQKLGQYVFKVNIKATKSDIKKAVEKHYKVKVASVNVMIVRGKSKNLRTKKGLVYIKKKNYKKAIVKLMPGHNIALVEGV